MAWTTGTPSLGGVARGGPLPLLLLALGALATAPGSVRAQEAIPPGDPPSGHQGLPGPEPAFELVTDGLAIPRDLAFAPDGRIFVTERAGRIRVVEDGRLRPRPWATLDVAHAQDGGLLDIALAPDFARSGHVYVAVTVRSGEGVWANRVLRLTERQGTGGDPTVVVGDFLSYGPHRGGALRFGPDGMLYVTTGDGRDLSAPQDPGELEGKLLRYRPDGSVPDDNPLAGSPVWALGLRNTQGLAWHPDTGDLFAVEHGPSGFPDEEGRRDEDELNVLQAGGNYGWPVISGRVESRGFIAPLAEWTPAIAPGGVAIYTGDDFPEWRGDAFVGGLRGQQLRRVELEPDTESATGWAVAREEALFEGELGRIRAVAMGPDGSLYFTTSNLDGDGSGRGTDGLYRLVPGAR